MFEEKADLWEIEADARCITTNGYVKPNGRAVMGRGCALQAKNLILGIDKDLGDLITMNGNIFQKIYDYEEVGVPLYSFPVKHHWREKADVFLIQRSALALMSEIRVCGYEMVALPRPGCGNGGLDWSFVKPLLEPILDGRVTVVYQ